MNESLPTELQELHAYVDDQLPPDERQRVEERLGRDPETAAQVREYAEIGAALRQLYGPVVDEPVPERLTRRHWGRSLTWSRPLAAMAASLLMLVVGTWLGWEIRGSTMVAGTMVAEAEENYLIRDAAMAYVVFTPEVRHPVEVPGDQEQHLASWLTKRIGAKVRPPRLDTLGYRLVGGRLVSNEDGPGALFMYEDTAGKRIVVYICRNDDAEPNTAFQFAKEDDVDVSVFYWFDGPLSYAVAGQVDRPGLLSLAEAVYRQIQI